MTRKWFNRGKASDQPTPSRKARNILVVGALTAVSMGGGLIAANTAQSAPTHQKLAICHATNSNKNPYVSENPNINATGLAGGHTGHTGPIWDPTLKGGGTKWGDILPPFDYQPKSGPIVHFPGLNWTAEGQQILNNGCNIPNTVVPVNPTVVQSVCSNHVATVPTLTLPSTPGITYSIDNAPVAGGTTTVTATAITPGNWFQPPAPAGWVFVDMTTETFTIHWASPTCTLPANGVGPVAPTVTQASCAGDPSQLVAPTLTLASGPAGVSYTVSADAPYSGGQTVTVTAIANSTSKFSAPGTGGWTFVNAHHETFVVTFNASPTCSGALANTGVKTTELASIGGIVLLLGLGLQFLGMGTRRRRTI